MQRRTTHRAISEDTPCKLSTVSSASPATPTAACSPHGYCARACALPWSLTLAAEACSVIRSRTIAPLVELHVSEGCNSCPSANRWLFKMKADPALVALAFHVDYADRIGWEDRFAKAAFTKRQVLQQSSNGERFGHTPHVIVDGQDRRNWPQAPTAAPAGSRRLAAVEIALSRVTQIHLATIAHSATIAPSARTPDRLAPHGVVAEQGHITTVEAGENVDVTLQRDYVVHDYEPVAAWEARARRERNCSAAR